MLSSRKIHLVSFADGMFSNRKSNFVKEADSIGLFNNIVVFDASMLASSFLEKHYRFMKNEKRGFGYWIWKPHVIEQVMSVSKPGDVIVYLDAGFTINSNGRERFKDYLNIALDSSEKMLSFQNVHTEHMWTKADLAHRLGVNGSPLIMDTSQLSSGFIIFCITKSNTEIVHDWQRIAIEDQYKFSSDVPSVLPNHADFIEHRHDQSIFSLLRKMRGTAITHYEVQPYSNFFENLKTSLPTWATRLRS